MKKFTIILSAIIFIAVLEINAQNTTVVGIQFEQTSWPQIVRKAKAENKLIFLDAYASWCGPCKYMAKNIFTHDEVAAFYNQNFINAKIDMEKGEGVEIAKKYGIKAYPTFLFIDGDGNVLHQACGGKEVEEFIKIGELASEDTKNTSAYIKKFSNSELTASFMNEYIGVLNEACISTDKELTSYFSDLDPKLYRETENVKLFNEYVRDYNNPVFKTLVNEQYGFSELMDAEQVDKKIMEVYSYSIKTAAKNNDKNEFSKIQLEIEASELETKEELLLKSDMSWYKYQKDWVNYANTAMEYVPNYAIKNYQELNSICWTFYENVEDEASLFNSLEWITTSLSIKEEYANQDTYAALLFKLGMKEQALEAANLAIKFAENEGTNAEETLKLLKKIEALN